MRLGVRVGTGVRVRQWTAPVVLIHFFSLGLKKLSPQRRCIIFSMSTPNFLAYMRANLVRVKAQPCRPAEKATVPLVGSTCTSPRASSW